MPHHLEHGIRHFGLTVQVLNAKSLNNFIFADYRVYLALDINWVPLYSSLARNLPIDTYLGLKLTLLFRELGSEVALTELAEL